MQIAPPTHAASEVQVATHGRQRPSMHQRRTAHCSSAVHVGIMQLPAPSHMAPGHPLNGSGAPLGTGLQTPMEPGSAQEVQLPEQAVLQQTPCAQNPLLHSLLAVQGVLVMPPHVPLRQRMPPKHSSLLAQVVLQSPRATCRRAYRSCPDRRARRERRPLRPSARCRRRRGRRRRHPRCRAAHPRARSGCRLGSGPPRPDRARRRVRRPAASGGSPRPPPGSRRRRGRAGRRGIASPSSVHLTRLPWFRGRTR